MVYYASQGLNFTFFYLLYVYILCTYTPVLVRNFFDTKIWVTYIKMVSVNLVHVLF